MTERFLGESYGWWIGIVTNVKDPHQAGRVQVRIFGRHDDKVNIPDKDLPWAQIMQPVTSAALGRIGTAPTGLLVGSRVIGMWVDRDRQYPLIQGTVGKSGDEVDGKTVDGAPEIDTTVGSIPAATQLSSANPYSTLNPTRVTVEQIDSGSVNIDSIKRDFGVVLTREVERGMSFPKVPSIAAINQTVVDILQSLRLVDPSGVLTSLQSFTLNALRVNSNIDLATLSGGLLKVQTGGVLDAMLGIAESVGVNTVLNSVAVATSNVPNFQQAVNSIVAGDQVAASIAMESLPLPIQPLAQATAEIKKSSDKVGPVPNDIKKDLNRGPSSIPANKPTPTFKPPKIVPEPPLGFIQEYYSAETDPYPGYIKWNDPLNEQPSVFTERKGQPNYTSAEEQTQYETKDVAITSLNKQLITANSKNPDDILTTMSSIDESSKESGYKNSVGAKMKPNSIDSMNRLIPPIVTAVKGNFLPKIESSTILPNAGPIKQAVTKHTASQATLQSMNISMKYALRSMN